MVIGEHRAESFRKLVVVPRVDHQRAAALRDLPHASEVRGDGWRARRDRFAYREAEALVEGRKNGDASLYAAQSVVVELGQCLHRSAGRRQLLQPLREVGPHEFRPQRPRLNRIPSRQSSSAAWSTARWFLRGSWLPTHKKIGRSATRRRRRADSRAAAVGWGAWTGRGEGGDVRPAGPAPAGIRRHPRYSFDAASEMATTRSICETAARLSAKTAGKPSAVVSGEVSGTQSKPMTTVRLRENRASALRARHLEGWMASSGRT
jgi:hypothetical protein